MGQPWDFHLSTLIAPSRCFCALLVIPTVPPDTHARSNQKDPDVRTLIWGGLMFGMLEVVTLTCASALFPDIDNCHVFIVSLYLFDSVPRQAESSVLRRLSMSGNLVISTWHSSGNSFALWPAHEQSEHKTTVPSVERPELRCSSCSGCSDCLDGSSPLVLRWLRILRFLDTLQSIITLMKIHYYKLKIIIYT